MTAQTDLGKQAMERALRDFSRGADGAEVALVYYAGHGFEIGGVNYLVPVDAKLAVDKDAETEAVALEQVIAAVGGARGLRLVMLDACRDNPFAPTMQRTIALKPVDRGFSNIEPSAGFMVVYAAKHGETALDGEGENSPFATALVRHIAQPGLDLRIAFGKVRDDENLDPANPLGTPLIRYPYTNHLGSATLETDSAGTVISYEEYHPFGTTA